MYTLDKLKNMSILLGNETVEGELATYFINNLDKLSTMTLQKCINDTGISKASIHRFYSKAGFINFKNFINVLNDETKGKNSIHFSEYISKVENICQNITLSVIDQSKLIKQLINAKQIVIYANIRDMYQLSSTISYLREHNKHVYSLNKWNIEHNYERLKSLNEEDVLIIINYSMNIQNYYEQSINNEYLLNLERIRQHSYYKFYIGQGNIEKYLGFKIIKLPHHQEELFPIILNLLDKYICEQLKKEC